MPLGARPTDISSFGQLQRPLQITPTSLWTENEHFIGVIMLTGLGSRWSWFTIFPVRSGFWPACLYVYSEHPNVCLSLTLCLSILLRTTGSLSFTSAWLAPKSWLCMWLGSSGSHSQAEWSIIHCIQYSLSITRSPLLSMESHSRTSLRKQCHCASVSSIPLSPCYIKERNDFTNLFHRWP